jgi:internalin A
MSPTHIDAKSEEILRGFRALDLPVNILSSEEFFHARNGLKLDRSGNIEGVNFAHCNIDDSRLKDVVMCFADATRHLRYLILSRNDICHAADLSRLGDLEYIDLSWNHVEQIDFINTFRNLRVALLMSNSISCCPDSVFNLNLPVKLQNDFKEGIFLQGNPLVDPPKEIFINNVAAPQYFKRRQDAFTNIREMRVIIIGSGGAGKTSLLNRLLGRPMDPLEPPTESVTIRTLGIGDCSVSLWDFAGQESMLSVHRFFLSERSLYLLVLDCRREETTDGWMNYIRSIAPAAPVIVILNRIDENGFHDLDRALLHRQYENILGFYRVSCATQQGVSEFLAAFEEIVQSDKRAAMRIPKEWNASRERLSQKLKRFLERGECETILVEGGMNSSEVDEFIAFSHNSGFIFHANVPTNDVVCRPQWLVKAVYPLIDFEGLVRAGAITAEDRHTGKVRLVTLRSVFKNVYADGSVLKWAELFPLVFDLMEQFGLCCRAGRDEIFVPELLGHETPPSLLDEAPVKDAMTACWTYQYLPKYIIHRLQIEFWKFIKDGTQWARGCVIFHPAFECEGLFTIDEKQSRLFVKLWKGDTKATFRIIRKEVREINERLGLTEVREGIVLEEGCIIDIEELEGLSEMGEQFYVSGRLRKKFSIRNLLSEYVGETGSRNVMVDTRIDQMRILGDRTDARP